MAVIQNDNGLVAVKRWPYANPVPSSIDLYTNPATYELLYRTQPELRSAVDFLARGLAQIPLHAYEMLGENERQRIVDTPLAQTLAQPDLYTTKTRWLQALVKDLCIYDAAYFVKVRGEAGRVALVRIPPHTVELLGENWLRPEGYRVQGAAGVVEFDANAVVDIHGYHPTDPRRGLSPIETLRRLLAEQAAAGEYREKFWQNSARMGGIIERPQAAPMWSDTARARFRADFEAAYTGANASGKTLVLEEGMEYKPVAFSARDAQYMEAFQLSREVVATAYGIPAGLLGLGSGTYASLSEQHRQLYADCFAPWAVLIQEELELQLLPEFNVPDNVYIEMNLQAKLAGSFTEQAAVLQASVGAPYLTRNEARARLNLPRVDGGDELVTPLNVLIGGQASPQDSTPPDRELTSVGISSATPEAKTVAPDAAKQAYYDDVQRSRRRAARDLEEALAASFERQRRSVAPRVGAKSAAGVKADVADVFNADRFGRELADDIRPAIRATAQTLGETVGPWDVENAANYLDQITDNFAAGITDTTASRLQSALDSDTPAESVNGVFDSLVINMAAVYATSLVTGVGEFARASSAQANGLRTKTWVVTSGNPRSQHALLNGELALANATFSNGALWPGDPALPVDQRANCECLLDWQG